MTSATPYRFHEHPDTLTLVWTVQDFDGEREFTVSGACPVCGCSMTQSFGPIQPVVAKGGRDFLGRRELPAEPEIWSTPCACDGYHQPRPERLRGCGAMLNLAPPPAHLIPGG